MRNTELSQADRYIEGLYAEEDAGLRAIRERLVNADRWGINIGANEGRLLQLLLKMINAKTGVELGTLFAYSSVWMARALPVDGKLYTIERDHECVRQAKKGLEDCQVIERVEVLEGDASVLLQQLSVRAPFDFVFIDANKSAYVEYLQWASAHVRKGGLIIADNTLLGGKLTENEKPDSVSRRQWTEMHKFNEVIKNDIGLFGTILPTTEGLTVALKVEDSL